MTYLVQSGGGDCLGEWIRNSDWLDFPALTSEDEKIYLLHAVFDVDSNFCAFTIAGNYTVDWGDGSAPENIASGASAYHNYDYADLSADTYCTRGYRQAIITITPQDGAHITAVDLNVKHNQAGLGAYSSGILEVLASIANSTSFNCYANVAFNLLESANFLSHGFTNGLAFRSCVALRRLLIGAPEGATGLYIASSSITSINTSFRECQSLSKIYVNCPKLIDLRESFYRSYQVREAEIYAPSATNNFTTAVADCNNMRIFTSDLANVTTAPTLNSPSLAKVTCGAVAVNISVANCCLSADALNSIFTELATVGSGTITITGNWGAGTCDTSIATAKGWTVTN